ncbi:MAG TPA: hypothetical protein VM101_04790 [Flavitalea sp.]|nr:hypothetical protein [Flavitalea sp.]
MMYGKIFLLATIVCCLTGLHSYSQASDESETNVQLPGHYIALVEAGIERIENKLDSFPEPTLALLEQGQPFGHFPHAILLPAVLYAKSHRLNKHFGDPKLLALAERIGDLLVSEYDKGKYSARNDTDWDTYMWLEAYRLLQNKLDEQRRENWKRVLVKNLELLEKLIVKYQDFPQYNAPFITTSPNHYAIYASTLLVGGHVFNKKNWVTMSTNVLHRFCVQEQTPDGYWGEHSKAGPTTGYDYVTSTQIAVYWEYSKDLAAIEALRKSKDFHKFFTYPDGTPVETINDRNRYWGVSMWGHFGFSHFPDGRRYASFLASFFPLHGDRASYGGDIQSLARIAQDFLYYHEGDKAAIPQESNYAHQMKITAGIRKTGSWVVTYSGIIAPIVSMNNFFLDRQANFSVYNKKTGLIISGANSKHQPELATFLETIGRDSIHMPVSSNLKMGEKDRLSLAYNVFFADIDFYKPLTDKMEFKVETHYKLGKASADFNLQLVLKAGQVLETGTGKRIILGEDKVDLDDDELGGVIKHNGWTLHIPKGMHLTWPVYTYNPYKSSTENDLSHAVGRLFTSLEMKNQQFPFTIEVN